jgi:hypothetical protein
VHFDEPKLSLHAYKEGPKIGWTQTSILQLQPNPTGQSSLQVPPLLYPLIGKGIFVFVLALVCVGSYFRIQDGGCL